jgi:hypothetical protein
MVFTETRRTVETTRSTERQGYMTTIEHDMDELALRVEYQHVLADHSKPLPLPFEQWRETRPILTNPATYEAKREPL